MNVDKSTQLFPKAFQYITPDYNTKLTNMSDISMLSMVCYLRKPRLCQIHKIKKSLQYVCSETAQH